LSEDTKPNRGPSLSKRRLLAIEEALQARLAGSLDDSPLETADYEGALRWARYKAKSKRRMQS